MSFPPVSSQAFKPYITVENATPLVNKNKRKFEVAVLTPSVSSPKKKFKAVQSSEIGTNDFFLNIQKGFKDSIDEIDESEIYTAMIAEPGSTSNSSESIDDDEYESLPSNWKEAVWDLLDNDEEENEGGDTAILTLLASNEVDLLSPKDKELILDAITASKYPNVILNAIKLNLTIPMRYRLLKVALNLNDRQIVEATINGCEEQPRLSFDEYSFSKPFKTIKILQNRGVDPEIIKSLYSISEIDQDDEIAAEWSKFLFNLWSMEDKKAFFSLKGETIKYEGATIGIFIDKISDSLKTFMEESPEKLDKELSDILYELIQDSKNLNPAEKLKKYKEGKPILINPCHERHQICILLWGNYYFLCNQGAFSDVPIKINQINSELVTEETLSYIQYGISELSLKRMSRFFKRSFPKQLGSTQTDPLTKLFAKEWVGSRVQEGQDCTYVSLKTAMLACAAWHYWLQSKQNESSLKEAYAKIISWDSYFRFKSIKNYQDYCLQNPLRKDENLLKLLFNHIKKVAPGKELLLEES